MIKIYKVLNTINNKVYIGKTAQKIRARWTRHISDARKGSDVYFCRAIRKYGFKSFTISQIDSADTDKEADSKEVYWIAFYKSSDSKHGYNSTLGGEGGLQTEEIKLKISKASKLNWENPEYRKKVVDGVKGLLVGENNPMYGRHEDHPWFGKVHSEESKQRMSDTHKKMFGDPSFKEKMIAASIGKHHTADGKANISKSLRGNQYRKGIPHSPEIKAQISASMRKAWRERRKKRELLNVPLDRQPAKEASINTVEGAN